MAVKIMSAVWEHAPVRGGELLVLLALADHANDSGTCFPSVPRLAQRARLSVRQTQRVLRHLESIGLVSRQHHAGRAGTDLFTVHTPDILTPPPPTPMTPGGDTHDAKGVTPMSPGTVIEPSGTTTGACAHPPDFLEFWRLYPRKVNKPRALRAWKQTAADRPALDGILAALRDFMDRDDWQERGGKFIPHPASWLTGHRWQEVETTPHAPTAPPDHGPDGWRAALSEMYPDADTSVYPTWGNVPDSLRDEVRAHMQLTP